MWLENGRGNKMFRKIMVYSLCITASIALIGCDKEKKENVKKSDIEIEKCSDIREIRSWSKNNKWETRWVSGKKDNSAEIVINATVSVPKSDSMSVVEVNNISVTGEDKQEIISSMFDKDECYYYDDAHKTKEMWQREIEVKINRETDSVKYENEELLEIKNQMEEKMKKAPNEMTKVVDYNEDFGEYREEWKKDSYYGLIDKNKYIVEVFSDLGGSLKYDYIYVSPYDDKEWAPETLKNATELSCGGKEEGEIALLTEQYPELTGENKCTITLDEAKQSVEKYVEKLGVPNAVCTEEQDLLWSGYVDGEKKVEKNGYYLSYSLGIGDEPVADAGVDEGFLSNEERENVVGRSMECNAVFEITDKGIYYMYITNPIKVKKVTGNVNLLPLGSIFDIIINHIDNLMDNEDVMKVQKKYSDLDLIYFRVANKEKSKTYSFIPVWRLTYRYENDGTQVIRNPILVNAISGEIIDVAREYAE